MFTWLEGSCTSPLVGSTPGGKCDWIYVFMHVGLVYSRQHLDFFVFVSKIDTFIRICKYRERLLHLRSIVHQWQRHLLQVRAGKEIVLKKSDCNKKKQLCYKKRNCVTKKATVLQQKRFLNSNFWNFFEIWNISTMGWAALEATEQISNFRYIQNISSRDTKQIKEVSIHCPFF